jgi:hypothetical protein
MQSFAAGVKLGDVVQLCTVPEPEVSAHLSGELIWWAVCIMARLATGVVLTIVNGAVPVATVLMNAVAEAAPLTQRAEPQSVSVLISTSEPFGLSSKA